VCVRFDELVLKIPGDELRVKFHPRMTVLSGLGAPERRALSESILGALAGGGGEATALRYVDSTGRLVNVLSGPGGSVQARHDDDGTPAPAAVLAATPERLRSLMIVEAADLGAVSRTTRDDEPRDLREARASLEEITEQLQEALGEENQSAALQAELDQLDNQLRAAHDGAARREYAKVLAQLERVRAEAAALQSGTAGIDADRQLLAHADSVSSLAARWTEAAEQLSVAVERFGGAERLDADELAAAAALRDEVPTGLDALVDAVTTAEGDRDAVDHRLQMLAVAKLPAPSDLIVGELGLLDQRLLWGAADRLIASSDEVHRVQVSLGGIGGDECGAGPVVIEDMEIAHRDHDAAEQAAESVRVPGVAGSGFGLAIATAGAIGAPLLIPIGLLIAIAVGTITLVLPRSRVTKAAALERVALERAGATSYLGFHLRRVDASVDPNVRGTVEAAHAEHFTALTAWTELAGPSVDVHHAKALAGEVQTYHDALRNLGGAADEIEQLRRDLAERAEPAVVRARAALQEACGTYGLSSDDLQDTTSISTRVTRAIHRGRAARLQVELEAAEAREEATAAALDQQLLRLGFDSGELDARLGALEWASARAAEREEARAHARPRPEIDAELELLQESARRLRRPEWTTVTAADAATPDIGELEERREKVIAKLDEVRPEVDVVRLADRHAALERRVMALEVRHTGYDSNGDPGAVADIQQHLLGRLTKAGQAGPHGDAVPALLDEVFLRVPAERKWDLLDLLYRLSERHQLVYLSDDPFVAAWARQCDQGSLSLLEPEPESV
jgi:hypothetical protein